MKLKLFKALSGMTGVSGISRRILLPFLAVVLVLVAELSWWMTFQVRQAGEQAQERLVRLQISQQLAAQHMALHAAVAGDLPHPESILASAFPDLAWETGPSSDAMLTRYYPDHRIVIRPEALARIDAARDRHIRMFAAEGLVFLVMVIAGVILILRALRREVALIKQQANFLSAVTHELKSPLASIRLYTETMQLRDVPKEKRANYLHAISHDVERLERLIANLLAAARLESDTGVLSSVQTVDLLAEVRAHVQRVQPELTARGARLQCIWPDDTQGWSVRIDPESLYTVIRNVLDNAVKYGVTPTQSTIALAVQREGQNGIITIQDWGMGLSPQDADRIFQKFYRVGDEMVRDKEGSGLGLYLVRGLLRTAGGDVQAHSAGPGLGTVFRVQLPLITAARTQRTDGAILGDHNP